MALSLHWHQSMGVRLVHACNIRLARTHSHFGMLQRVLQRPRPAKTACDCYRSVAVSFIATNSMLLCKQQDLHRHRGQNFAVRTC